MNNYYDILTKLNGIIDELWLITIEAIETGANADIHSRGLDVDQIKKEYMNILNEKNAFIKIIDTFYHDKFKLVNMAEHKREIYLNKKSKEYADFIIELVNKHKDGVAI